MSHPYSGAAGYIYANEYRPQSQRAVLRMNQAAISVDSGKSPLSQPLYNYHHYASDQQLQTGPRTNSIHSDPSFHSLDDRSGAKPWKSFSPMRRPNPQITSPLSVASSLPSNHAPTMIAMPTQTYSSPIHNHPYSYPATFPVTPTSPAYSQRSNRHPLKLKLTLPNPFRQHNPSNLPWPPRSPPVSPPNHLRARTPKTDPTPNANWRWSSFSTTKFKLSAWLPSIRRKPSKSKGDSSSGLNGRSSSVKGRRQSQERSHVRSTRLPDGVARSKSYRSPVPNRGAETAGGEMKRGKSLRFVMGMGMSSGRKAERDLDFSVVSV